jgi:carboxylesterase type B
MPVMMFIHGGNFVDGYAGGTDPAGGILYDGSETVNTTGVVVRRIHSDCMG